MQICPNCFIQNRDDVDHCYECGTILKKLDTVDNFDDYIIEVGSNIPKDEVIENFKDETSIVDGEIDSPHQFKVDELSNEPHFKEEQANFKDELSLDFPDNLNLDFEEVIPVTEKEEDSLKDEQSLDFPSDLNLDFEKPNISIEDNDKPESNGETLKEESQLNRETLKKESELNGETLKEESELNEEKIEEFIPNVDYVSNELVDDNMIESFNKKTTLSAFDYLISEDLDKGSVFLGREIIEILGASLTGVSILVKGDKDELMVYRLIDRKYYNSYEDFYTSVAAYQNAESKNRYQIYDFGRKDGFYYILTSYIEGVCIKNILKSKKEKKTFFTLEQSISIVLQIIEELEKVSGVISHKFITPESIIIDKLGNVTLINFGIYHSITPATRFRLSTSKDDYTDFIAPELMSKNSVNPILSDIYSVGVIFYLLLTGKTPQNDFKLPILNDQEKSERLTTFFDSCFHPNPEKRFQDFSLLTPILLSLTDSKKVVKNIKEEKEREKEVQTPTAPPVFKKVNRIPPPPTFSKPPTFKPKPKPKPSSIKDSKLNLPIKERVNEFDTYQNKKGDVTLGELDDVERWFFVKDGIDYGPISAKKIRELVEAGELASDSMIKTLTHPIKKGKIEEIDLFQNFLKDFTLKESEKEMQDKMSSFKRKKIITSIVVFLLLIGIGGGIFYINSKTKTKHFKKRTEKEILIDGQKLKEEQARKAKEQAIADKKIEDEINKELERELVASTKEKVAPEIKKEREKKIKKRGKRYYRKYLALKKKREEAARKKAEELAILKAAKEKENAFNTNKKVNEDVASISFKGKNSGKDLSNQEIKNKINTKKREIINCFVKEYNRGIDLPPKLFITYSVRQDGKFYAVTIQHPRYKNKRGKLNYCILKVFRSMSFQPFSGGTKVGRMPLEFSFE